jgi:outer membrane lipoprotein SlyB
MHARNTFLGLIIGGFVGALAGNFVVAAIVGAVLGQLLGRVGELERRLRQLDASSRKARQQDLGFEKTPISPETPEIGRAHV